MVPKYSRWDVTSFDLLSDGLVTGGQDTKLALSAVGQANSSVKAGKGLYSRDRKCLFDFASRENQFV